MSRVSSGRCGWVGFLAKDWLATKFVLEVGQQRQSLAVAFKISYFFSHFWPDDPFKSVGRGQAFPEFMSLV